MIIIIAEFDEESYTYLIEMLNKRYYQTEDTQELKKINQLYKILKFKSEDMVVSYQIILG